MPHHHRNRKFQESFQSEEEAEARESFPFTFNDVRYSEPEGEQYVFISPCPKYSLFLYLNAFFSILVAIVATLTYVVKYMLTLLMWTDALECVERLHSGIIDWDMIEKGGNVLIISEGWITFTLILFLGNTLHIIFAKLNVHPQNPVALTAFYMLATVTVGYLSSWYHHGHYQLLQYFMGLHSNSCQGDKQVLETFENCLRNESEVRYFKECFPTFVRRPTPILPKISVEVTDVKVTVSGNDYGGDFYFVDI